MDQSISTNEEKTAQTVKRFTSISPNVEPEVKQEEKPTPVAPKVLEGSDKDYYDTTHNYLDRERKERNAIIMRIDKIEDELFSTLTPEQRDIKNTELKNQFIDTIPIKIKCF